MDSMLQTRTRFEFPALPFLGEDLPMPDAPRAIWPEPGGTETVQACGELAQGLRRRLSPKRPAILAFTSPGDGDGKTSLLIHLAPELARHGHGGVLVVDANFHKPDLTSRLTVSAGRKPLGSAVIYPTNLPGLNVLPMSPQRGCWLEELRESWPLVLVDMASLAHAEAAAMLRRCDGVCLVVRLGHTVRRAVAKAPRLIRNVGGRLLGCVVVE
jgi:Mrp family chromosome partitioning ATPase